MKYFILFFTILIVACTSNRTTVQPDEIVKINCKPIKSELFIGLPIQLTVKDKYLIINDFKISPMLSVYDLERDTLYCQLFNIGRGPLEEMPPLQMCMNDNNLLVYGRNTHKLYFLSKLTSDTKPEILTTNVNFNSYVSTIFPLDSIYIASGTFSDGRYALFNNQGDLFAYTGDYPNYMQGEDNLPLQGKGMFHQSLFFRRGNSKQIGSATSHVLDLYNYDQSGLHTAKRILLAPYDYLCRTGNILEARASESTQRGVIGACATFNYIYLLFNPNKAISGHKSINEIWVFDWNGIPIKKILPDKNFSVFTINDAGSIIYGIDYDLNLYKINLNV